jgi:hypothetical protein
VGAGVWERGARSDQAGRRGVQAGGLQGVLRACGHARRAVECHVAYCHQWLRETVSEPHRGADDRHDHQQPDDAHYQHPRSDTDHVVPDTDTHTDHVVPDTHTDHVVPDTDTNDGVTHAYAYDQQRTAAADACDANAITWPT